MSILQMIYNIFIGPLELLFEVIYVSADRVIDNPGYTIIVLSLAMNILVLPLYRRADALQSQERDVELRLKPGVDHIKKTFKGDERFMMLQTYYRQNGYRPTHALKGSISLLLEIPFFIATYHFLSHLQVLSGKTLGPIKDLGAPDGLIQAGDVSINLLPILMTLINVVSAAIYMKGMPAKNKIQMYGVAAIFLVLLYQSPAGLVFYWTLNNVFSLGKNISYKVKNSGLIIKIMLSAAGWGILLWLILLNPLNGMFRTVAFVLIALAMQIPIFIDMSARHNLLIGKSLQGIIATRSSSLTFYLSVIFLTVLSGLLIPSALINGSATEFIDVNLYYSPLWIIISALTLSVGTFLIWFVVFYKLASEKGKYIISLVVLGLGVLCLINYMFFGQNYGNISPQLRYDAQPLITAESIIFNLLICGVAFVATVLIFRKNSSLINVLLSVSIAAGLCMSLVNMVGIQNEISDSNEVKQIKAAGLVDPEIKLSKEGKNVVVIMMDRQLGFLLPYIINEKPEIKEAYDGFTYYPNTVSFGNFTNVGVPALYGGYDYTPENINRRDTEKLVDKHNEALKVMPKVFSDAGYEVTICDPPYAGYGWIPDLSVFDNIKNSKSYITEGRYSLEDFGYYTSADIQRDSLFRNIFCYSIFKMSPDLFKHTVYFYGNYNNSDEVSSGEQIVHDNDRAHGFRESFMNAYGVLYHLSGITRISKDKKNTFLMISNNTAHEEMLLQEPDYIPSLDVDNTRYEEKSGFRVDAKGNRIVLDNQNRITHYQVNMAAVLKMGEWFDYLKDNELYDNTRIIVVSDHGRNFVEESVKYLMDGKEKKMDPDWFKCTLMVKDFNSHGFKVDNRFSTNADTPAHALKGIVPKPVNPYTKNPILPLGQTDSKVHLIYTFDYKTTENNGNVFTPADWFTVRDDIQDPDNWEYIGHK